MIDAALFQKIFLFQDIKPDELHRVLDRTSLREFPAGTVIIQEGEPGDSLFIMAAGEVEITKQLTLVLDEDTPKERVMIRLKAENGVYFGEMALLESETRSATVTALTDCSLLELHQKDFLELIEQHPAMGVKLLLRLAQILSRHLRKTNQDVVKLTTALAISLGRLGRRRQVPMTIPCRGGTWQCRAQIPRFSLGQPQRPAPQILNSLTAYLTP